MADRAGDVVSPQDSQGEHFPGCHPEDAEDPRPSPPVAEIQDTEDCWHCGTPTTRGACGCTDCWDGADYIPVSAVSHCPVCKRWWAYMTGLNVTEITFTPGGGGEAGR
jgi:hypothetical protein